VARNDPERTLRDLGRRIAELRESRGLTQEQLAGSIDISPRYIQRIEAGEQNVTILTLILFAEGLGVKVTDLFIAPRSKGPRPPGRPKRAR
jgi:transcriptional regulator with XRE-family HTH domain